MSVLEMFGVSDQDRGQGEQKRVRLVESLFEIQVSVLLP